MEFKVEFYHTVDGKEPVMDFLDSLNPKLRAKMVGLIDVLQESGNRLREPYTKSLGNGIFELRAKHGNDLARSLFFFYHEGRIIITNGFVKKTRKTPRSEIDTAKKYRKDFYCQEGAK